MVTVATSARVYDRNVGGNTRYVRTIYPALGAHGVDVRYLRPSGSTEHSLARTARYAVSESLLWPHSVRNADVVHFPADTGAITRGRLPIVSTIHGLATLHIDSVRSAIPDAIWKARVRRLATVSKVIITVSESSARDIARFSPGASAKLRVVHHGIDHERFHARKTDPPTEFLERFSVPERYFLYLGNLDPRKNIVELAAASASVFRKTGVPLVVAGAPAWESSSIINAVTSTPGVIYVGRVDEDILVPLMQNALGFCFPSNYEGFGFPVLEAMACGTPVISSDRGSLKEVALDAALILDGTGRRPIESAMLRLETDRGLRGELKAKGLARASEFSWENATAAHAEIFREAAS